MEVEAVFQARKITPTGSRMMTIALQNKVGLPMTEAAFRIIVILFHKPFILNGGSAGLTIVFWIR